MALRVGPSAIDRVLRRRASVVRYAIALAAVVGMSLLIGSIITATQITRISILYLIVVLPVAMRLGRGPAILASLTAMVVYDWFYAEPYHQFAIRDPDEWISLGLFFVTAIITAELAANARMRADQAEHREREARLLFDALRLMSDPDIDGSLRAVAERLRSELHAAGVSITLEVAASGHEARAGDVEAVREATDVLGGGRAPTATHAGGPARWIRVIPPDRRSSFDTSSKWRRYAVPVRAEGATKGQLTLVRAAGQRPFSEQEGRSLALIAGLLSSLAQRTELHEATTRAKVAHRADELKSTLLAAVSHDLRTPLASIIASAGSLRQADVEWSDAERRAFVADIETEARRLSRIVDNLLDLSRMESGALRPDRSWYDIAALVDDVLGRLRPVTVGRPMQVNVPDDLPPVSLDYVEIDQVLSNLIENAVRHTPAGTAITVSAHVDRDELVVEVADAGPGIDPRALPHLFGAFFRGAARHGSPGTGLGLAVARGLVEAHGGTIIASNRAAGGAMFRFTLPLSGPKTVKVIQ